ncbi:tRNA glutamyl-Q(34) synthetase GluQRS [Luteimonas sp. R10]|uniref:tRNA glutamyl-Q(34) synthetase GluQRS n=1 Tax=Luteimonas sp. R10 TaxID=3108176 RepID=UPI003087D6A2|nr:tRNA glutamyl-Q(34) synthetase GluQRS [Luteimonas sp. R10]
MPSAPATPAAPPYRGRFAPSPTGPLHFGSLLTALGSWLLARRAGGEWRVRIEDLDPPREVAGAAQAQLRSLHAFGLAPDGEVLRQSARGSVYRAALDRLLAAGDAFICHCSRSGLSAGRGVHHACLPGALRTDPSVRMRVPAGTRIVFDDLLQGRVAQDLHAEVGDFVLRRADGCWAYQLAVVVDDAAQGITDVVRGADLLDSTPRQIFLQHGLGLPTPRYAHLPLALDADGRKLSKSLAAVPVDDDDPLPALRAAWRALGQAPSAVAAAGTPARLLAAALRTFDPAAIPHRHELSLAASHNTDGTAAP